MTHPLVEKRVVLGRVEERVAFTATVPSVPPDTESLTDGQNGSCIERTLSSTDCKLVSQPYLVINV